MSRQTIAGQVRKQMNPELDNFEVGQEVIARFTNANRILEFRGKVQGRTKNYWKVESITAPYPNEKPGRMFQIATLESRIYSANNCIVKLYVPEPEPEPEAKSNGLEAK